ncbi:MAG: hypothetical protein LBD67_06430 [Candidatus Accumulibacter sp.]|jgi:hypothetical protein|nr:hypothetical protein [Accumulibacter sp.]
MVTQKTSILVSATDNASTVLMNIAGRMEKINKSMSGFGKLTGLNNVAAGVGLINQQMGGLSKTWDAFRAMSRWSAIALGGAGAATLGLVNFAKSSNDAARKVDDLSGKYQIGAQTLQVYGALVADSGGSMEEAAAAMSKLKKSQNEAIHGNKEAAAAFAGVGISVAGLKSMRPEDVLQKMGDAFKGSNNDLAKQAVLLKLMGKNGESMMDTLNGGSEAYRRQLAEMREDGALFSEEQLKNSRNFDAAWNRASRAFSGIKNTLGVDLAKNLVPVVDAVRAWALANKNVINSGFQNFVKHPPLLDAIVPAAKTVWAVIEKAAAVIKFLGHTFGMTTVVLATFGVALGAPLVTFGLLIAKIGLLGASLLGLGGGFGVAAPAVGSLSAKLAALNLQLLGVKMSLGSIAALAGAAFAGWKAGGWLNDKINAKISEKTGGKNDSLGGWLYDKTHASAALDEKITPEEIARARAANAGRFRPAASSHSPGLPEGVPGSPEAARRITAADVAGAQKQEIKNTLDIRITADGRAKIETMRTGSPQTEINVDSGLMMQGA